MKIKVCGMRDPENIAAVAALYPDYMGFIFYPGSARYVDSDNADAITALPASIKRTGVFVNATMEAILDRVKQFNLVAVQLHGKELPGLCRDLQLAGLEVIKAFGVDQDFDFESLAPYGEVCDYFLFDTKTSRHGGSGKVFDWGVLSRYTLNKPYFISGGLGPENIAAAMQLPDNRLYAADLNSKFETAPAMKDIQKLAKAITLIKESAVVRKKQKI